MINTLLYRILLAIPTMLGVAVICFMLVQIAPGDPLVSVIDTIIPVLDEMRAKGMYLSGPLPADTLFQPKYLDHADAVLAMYHDQGLPVLKYQGFGRGVNITLGLPFVPRRKACGWSDSSPDRP